MRYTEPIAFDYLSRLERGQLMPSVPKLATLAEVYGRPLSDLIDLYEIEQLRKLVPKKGTYAICRQLGLESLEKGSITKALACFLGALDAAKRESAEPQKLAVAFNNVGHALAKGGRYLTARRYLEEGLRLVESPRTRVRLLDNLAIVHYQLDNLLIADLLSREAASLAGEDEDLRPAVRATRATVLLDLKIYAESESLTREALAEYRRLGLEGDEIREMYNLGHCLVGQGRMEEGFDLLRSAAARAVERGDPMLRAKSLFFFGRCLYVAGRKDDAIAPLKSALRIARAELMRNEIFHSAFYLWQLAHERGPGTEETEYEAIARQYRVRLEQRSEEARAFDSWLAQRRRKARSRPHGKR